MAVRVIVGYSTFGVDEEGVPARRSAPAEAHVRLVFACALSFGLLRGFDHFQSRVDVRIYPSICSSLFSIHCGLKDESEGALRRTPFGFELLRSFFEMYQCLRFTSSKEFSIAVTLFRYRLLCGLILSDSSIPIVLSFSFLFPLRLYRVDEELNPST